MPEKFWYLLGKKLTGEASHEELTALQQMLLDNPRFSESALQIKDFWEIPAHNLKKDADSLWEKQLSRLSEFPDWKQSSVSVLEPNQPTTRPFRRLWWAAAAVCILGGIYWLSNPTKIQKSDSPVAERTIATQPGSRTHVNLPDGSEVWVNADSKLHYASDFGKTNRNLWLEGEAYFDVKKDPSLPFIIKTSRFSIKVTGTAFNVRSYPNEKISETSLIRGQIIVTLNKDSTQHIILHPTQKLRINDETAFEPLVSSDAQHSAQTVIRDASIPQVALRQIQFSLSDSQVVETAWVRNKLEFNAERFRDVADKMEHWYGIQIIFSDKKLESEILKGSFINETLEEALYSLSLTTRFEYIITNNEVIIKPKK